MARDEGRPGLDRPLRVAAYTDVDGLGGAEISLGHLLGALPADRVEVTVVGVHRPMVEWLAARRPAARPVVVAAGPGPYGLAAHLTALRRLRPDVLHVNLCVPWACWTGLAAGLALPGLRVVAVEQLPLRTTEARLLWRTRGLALRLDAHVAVGTASCRRVEDFYALGRGSLRSIPNCVPDLGPPPPRPARRRDDVLHVGAVGRLDAMKGHDVLLRALAQVQGVRATVIGAGDGRGELEKLAADLGLADRVDLRGWVPDPRPELAGLDAFAQPSRSEGFPLSVLEAMLAGLPVVATPVGSVAEAVADGETGLLVPVDDAAALAAGLRRLRDEPELGPRLGARGREVAAAQYTVEHMARAYLELWTEVCARPAAPRARPPAPPG